MYSFSWNQSIVSCPVLTAASWPPYRFLKRQVRWSGIPISFRIFQFIVIHTVKGFGIVNKAEIDVFLELSWFFHDPADVGNLISGSSVFSKTSLNIRKFTVHVLLKPGISLFMSLYIFQIPLLTLFRVTISCFVQSRPLLNIKRAAIKITLRQQVQNWITLGKKGYTYGPLVILHFGYYASNTLTFIWFFRHIFIPILGTCSNGSILFEHSSSRLYTERSFLTFMP